MKEVLYSLIALSIIGLAAEAFSGENQESNFSLMNKADNRKKSIGQIE